MAGIFDIIIDSFIDTIKLLPFLFLTYTFMEYLEHRASGAAEKVLKRSGQFGSLIGSALGILPQCGFSSAAAGLFSARIISLGTLIAVFLSTSDEMIPIFISRGGDLLLMIKILLVKFAVASIAGLVIDAIVRAVHKKRGTSDTPNIEDICKRDNCHCHSNILKSALIHTGKISIFILIFTFILNFLVYFVGKSNIALLVLNKPILANVLSAIVGLIPNCASSVIISDLFVKGILSPGAMLSGLLVNSGVALAVLFRTNRPKKQNWMIVGLLLAISIIVGIIVDLTPLAQWLTVA